MCFSKLNIQKQNAEKNEKISSKKLLAEQNEFHKIGRFTADLNSFSISYLTQAFKNISGDLKYPKKHKE